jgi:hypothetical protein
MGRVSLELVDLPTRRITKEKPGSPICYSNLVKQSQGRRRTGQFLLHGIEILMLHIKMPKGNLNMWISAP